jgi:hypothetical protein
MLSSVLHSQRAIDVNVEIMRAFVRLGTDACLECSARPKVGCFGKEIRRPIQGGVRRDPAADGIAGAQEAKDWISGRRKSCGLRTALVSSHVSEYTLRKHRPLAPVA